VTRAFGGPAQRKRSWAERKRNWAVARADVPVETRVVAEAAVEELAPRKPWVQSEAPAEEELPLQLAWMPQPSPDSWDNRSQMAVLQIRISDKSK
jgi:hypothetical protein